MASNNQNFVSGDGDGDANSQVVATSTFTFNANAQEFVPRSVPVQQYPADVYNNQQAAQQPHYDPLELVQNAITYLTMNPASYDDYLPQLLGMLNIAVDNVSALTTIVDEIFETSVMEPNFRYTGARMCDNLSQNLDKRAGNFRNVLLARCKKEHDNSKILAENESTTPRLIGYTLFLAELFQNVRINNAYFHALVKPLNELISLLVGECNVTYLKNVVQILKLSGQGLDDCERENSKSKCTPILDGIFDQLKEKIVDNATPRNLRVMMLSLVELRAKRWGRMETTEPEAAAKVTNVPVFYDSNGEVMPQELSCYVQEELFDYPDPTWEGVEEDDYDEMEEAYEQFLADLETKDN